MQQLRPVLLVDASHSTVARAQVIVRGPELLKPRVRMSERIHRRKERAPLRHVGGVELNLADCAACGDFDVIKCDMGGGELVWGAMLGGQMEDAVGNGVLVLTTLASATVRHICHRRPRPALANLADVCRGSRRLSTAPRRGSMPSASA